MTRLGMLVAFVLAAAAGLRLEAAVNPEEFKRIASDVVRLREIARVVEPDSAGRPGRQRVTIVGEIVAVERSSAPLAEGDVVLIDYAIDLTARAAAAKEYEVKMGRMPGRQFMYEPDPPPLDANREFRAHLAPAGGRLANVNRHAGRAVVFDREQFSGPVFVPVAGQYSWDVAVGPLRSADGTKESKAMEKKTYTGTLRTGVMAIGAETTGINLETDSWTYELDVRGNPEAAAKVDSLHGKKVVVTGDYRPRPGVEVRERRIIVVHTLSEAP